MKKTLLLVSLLLSGINLQAQKIDFNMTGRSVAEVNTEGYFSWQVTKQESERMEVFPLFVTAEATRNADVVRSQWSKNDLKGKNLKLTGDAIVSYLTDDQGETPNPTEKSMGIKFTISGLSAGEHTIHAYHNGVNGYKNLAPIDIYVNGVKVSEGIKQSENAQSETEAAATHTKIMVSAGSDANIEYVSNPVDGQEYGSTLVYVNALTIE